MVCRYSFQEYYSCKLYQNCQSNDIWLKINENLKLTEYFFKPTFEVENTGFAVCGVVTLYRGIEYIEPVWVLGDSEHFFDDC